MACCSQCRIRTYTKQRTQSLRYDHLLNILMTYLSTSEMHTSPLGESVSEVTVGAGDSVLGQMLLQPRRLVVRVVLLLPPGEILATEVNILR